MAKLSSTRVHGNLTVDANINLDGTIQNGSIWINNGVNQNNYNENIRLFNAPNGASVITFGSSGTGGRPQNSMLGYSDRLEWRVANSDDWRARIYSSGLQINGTLGVGTTSPDGSIHSMGRINLHQSGSSGGQNRFTGVDVATSANGRAQFIMSSSYSDLVIASSQSNNVHGSTLTFASYNPSNAADYRKFVVNQGGWGSRFSFLDFGYTSNNPNPHTAITSALTTLTIDGGNRRVGIKQLNPNYELEVGGSIYANNGAIRVAGQNPFFFESYGGGWYMADTTWIRTYNSKNIYQNTGIMRTDGTLQVGGDGSTLNVGNGGSFSYRSGTLFANTSNNVGIGTTSPGYKLDVQGTGRFTGDVVIGSATLRFNGGNLEILI